jgi:signal transduction histidine kinase/ActR/RegA family two-component response regulator
LDGFLSRVFISGAGQSCEIGLTSAAQRPKSFRLEGSLSPDQQECRAVLSDITERKALEEQLLHSQRMASIGTLSAGIAHDLNNTLTPIVLSASLLSEEVADPKIRGAVETIQASALRGASVVRQLLMFTRGIEGARVTVQVDQLLQEMAVIVRETFPRALKLKIEVDASLRPVRGDPAQLHQVLMNLCLNARDAMPDGGELRLLAQNLALDEDFVRAHPPAKPGPHVAVMVSDTGHGIPPENLDRIFEPFFTTKVRERGTGLGLSTAYGIVHSHAGFITVASPAGAGATFTVFLPAAENADVAIVSTVPAVRGSGEVILVVDDEPAICRSVELVLTNAGYIVETAGGGTEALAKFQECRGRVRLVMTDVMMPAMAGKRFIQLLRREEPNLKIIAFTGVINPEVRSELVAVGVNRILMKPCEPQELLYAVGHLISAVE